MTVRPLNARKRYLSVLAERDVVAPHATATSPNSSMMFARGELTLWPRITL